jgi:hypothetical protein
MLPEMRLMLAGVSNGMEEYIMVRLLKNAKKPFLRERQGAGKSEGTCIDAGNCLDGKHFRIARCRKLP